MNRNGTCLICGADLVYFSVNTNHKPHIVCDQIIGFTEGIPDGNAKCETGHEFRFHGNRELKIVLGKDPLLANWNFDDEIDEDPKEDISNNHYNINPVIRLSDLEKVLEALPIARSKANALILSIKEKAFFGLQ